jgi:hypothetical protein
MIGADITREQAEQIRVYSAAGMLQRDIAVQMDLHKSSIGAWQRKLGCSPKRKAHEPLPTDLERNILALLKKGWGAPRIMDGLVIPMHLVYRVKKKFRIQRKPGTLGCRYGLGVLELRAIRLDIRKSEKEIARRHGVPHAWLRRFRNKMWRS